MFGRGVEVDKKKAIYFWELAAMGGNAKARYNLGIKEMGEGNMERALKHWMIAIRSGDNESLNRIQKLYPDGHVTKDDYMKALQSEIKSKQRDEAAAYDNEKYRYY